MNWSWTIGKVRGIPIRLHFTLLFFLPYVAFIVAMQFRIVADFLGVDPSTLVLPPLAWGVLLALGLFVGILLHELGHSFVAISSGARVRSITLMMLGGVSQITDEIRSPAREAWMAVAGPLVSFAISGLSYLLFMALLGVSGDLSVAALVFALINLVIGIFNLLPAFPMDGGRILRAAFTPWLGRLRATRLAARIGQAMAILLGIAGLTVLSNPLLILIAFFIFMGASMEARMVEARESLTGVRMEALVDPRIGRTHAHVLLADVADAMLQQNLVACLVSGAEGEGPGLITVWDLERIRGQKRLQPVGELARKRYPVAKTADDVATVIRNLHEELGSVILVIGEGGEPKGVVTAEDMMRAARLRRGMPTGRPES
jgi:Zn-dependent protease